MFEEFIEMCNKIQTSHLVAGTWGNISIKVDNKIYITPSGIPYNELIDDYIAILDLNGNQIGGSLKASSEKLVHIYIYNKRNDVNAIIHTHSTYATTASLIVNEIPAIVEDAVMALGAPIRVSEYAFPGTEQLAINTVNALEDKHGVILKNHGQIAIGKNLDDAYLNAVLLEKTAELYIKALSTGIKVNTLPKEDVVKLREVYINSYSKMKDKR